MMSLLVFKERLKAFYAKFGAYVTPVIKFFVGFMTFYFLNKNIGFMTKLNHPLAPLVLGLLSSFLPFGAIALLAAGVMLAHLFTVSMEIGLIALVFVLVIMLLYYGFEPGDSYLMLLTPLLFMLKIPYAVPLLVGLSGSLVSVIPVSCGVFLYYMIMYVKQNAGVLTGGGVSVEAVQKYTQIIKSLTSNQMMLVMTAAFALSIIVVYLIKNLSIDYAWYIAIAAGTITQLVVIFIGDFKFDIAVSIFQLLAGILGSALIACIYNFFVFALDYSRTEYTQFEDDEYYYYVKAVPKVTVTTPDVKVKRINPRKGAKR